MGQIKEVLELPFSIEVTMDLELLFSKALGIEAPWRIVSVHFDSAKKRLDIKADFARGSTFEVTEEETGISSQHKAYDTVEKTWRHLNFFEHECYITARTPRVKTDSGCVKMILPPWSGVVAGFTMLFEALVMRLCLHTPVHQVGKIVNVEDRRLWRVLDCYVVKGQLQADHANVRAIGLDETSARRGHHYITLFVDMAERKTIHVAVGKDHRTVHEFGEEFESCNGKKTNVTDISCDMSPAFIKGVKEVFPEAQITFDKFHVIKLINESVDAVRRAETPVAPCLKGSRFALLKNEVNRTSGQQRLLESLSKMNLKTMKALRIREAFQEIYQADTHADFELLLKKWYFWATHSRLAPIIKVAKTVKRHWDGILRWKASQINNGILEGLNSVIQAAKRKAKGYKDAHFKTMALLLTGKFDFSLINPYLPTRFA